MNQKIETISPVDGSVYVSRDYASQEQIEFALISSAQAQQAWRLQSLQQRQKICHQMVDAFVANKDQIAEQICWQMGRPIRYAAGEVDGVAERARYMIDAATEALAAITIEDGVGGQGANTQSRYIKREALGTVFVVAPWNYPYLTAINSIIPAIVAGNSVILKHSAQTPLCAEQFAAAFSKAGLPEGVFQYLHLTHRDTESVIASDKINHVAFTGSVAGGEMVERVAAGQFKGIGLELGGKDPAYIRADADIEKAVATVIDGAFFNSGQSCCGIERVYVHESIFEAVIEKAVALVNSYVLGPSYESETTLGPLVKVSAAEFVRAQIKDAIEKGATALIDESRFPMSKAGTAYLAPQILVNVNHSMRVMTEETFGPLVGIQSVASDREAIDLMNDSEFGLTASVFSSDLDAATAIGEQVNTGTFFVNRCDYLDPALAWVGVKHSGRGCTLSALGYEHLTRPKSFNINRQ